MAKPKVAVVNDDTAYLDMLRELLDQEGYDTIIHKEHQIVHDVLRRENPDLAIVDARLEHPENSWSIVQLLRLDPRTVHIPVLVTSTDPRIHEKAPHLVEQGCDVLEKPFDLDNLLTKVGQMIGRLPVRDLRLTAQTLLRNPT